MQEKQDSMFQLGTNMGTMRMVNDEDFTILEVDSKLCDMLGYSQGELIGYCRGKAIDLVFVEDYQRVYQSIKNQINESGEFSCKYRVRKKDGTFLWVQNIGSCSILEDGSTMIQSVYINVEHIERLEHERDIFSHALPGAIAYFDITKDDYMVSDANDKFFRLLRVSRAEYFAAAKKYTYGEDISKVKDHFAEKTKTKEDVSLEFRVRGRRGKLIWYHMYGSYYEEIPGGMRYLCVLVDVTDRRDLRMRLMREKERYRIAMTSTADLLFEYFVEDNKLCLYPREDLKERGMNLPQGTFRDWKEQFFTSGMVHPEDHKKVFGAFRMRRQYDSEIRILVNEEATNSKEYKWFRIHVTAILERGGQGRAVGFLHSVEGEREERIINDEIRRIFDLKLVENYERIVKIDLKTGEHFQYSGSEADYYKNKRWEGHDKVVERMGNLYVHRDDMERFIFSMRVNRLKEELNSGEAEGVKYFRIKGPTGEYRWKCYRYSYLGADINSIVVSVQDVHDIRIEQQNQEEANRRILIDALSEAKKASEARNNFFAMVTKEVRAPLNVIREMSNHVLEESPYSLQERLERIHEASGYLSLMVDDMLDMERAEKGTIRFVRNEVDLISLIIKIRDEQRQLGQENDVQIKEVIMLSSGRRYFGDRFRVHQIISNVLTNAVKFSKRGGSVRFVVTEKEETESRLNLVISVEDQGVPIHQDYFERIYSEEGDSIFEKGVQSVEGTGFSLILCKKIAELMGGTATVSRGNRGENCFRIVIPLDYAGNSVNREKNIFDDMDQEKKEISDEIKVVDLSSNTILLIESNEHATKTTGALLKVNGANVSIADCAKDGLKIWLSYPPNTFSAILVDAELPDITPVQLTDLIRNEDREDAKDIPIVLMAENIRQEEIQKGFRRGINANVGRPMDLSRLSQVIEVFKEGNF